jgi:predicted CoA-binding protein
MNTKKDIDSVISNKKLAFIGVSGDPKKFSRMAYKELKQKGFELYPVNPKLQDVDGDKCYQNIADVPSEIKWALLMTPKDSTAGALKEAIDSGIENVWIQQGAHTDKALAIANENKVNLVYNKCIMMFASPVKGVHSFHRFLAKIFGKVPS